MATRERFILDDTFISSDASNGWAACYRLVNGKIKSHGIPHARARVTGAKLNSDLGSQNVADYADFMGQRYSYGDGIWNLTDAPIDLHQNTARRYGGNMHLFLMLVNIACLNVESGSELTVIVPAPPGLLNEVSSQIKKSILDGESGKGDGLWHIQLRTDKKPREYKFIRVITIPEGAGAFAAYHFNLLKQGEDPVVSSPHPLVLRSISEVLGLDVVHVLQMLDYVPSDYHATPLSPIGVYVGLSFDQLQPDGQRVLLGVLATLTGDGSISSEDINALAQAARDLRIAYPMFIERRFDIRDEFGRTVGSFLGMFSEAQLLHTITRRLSELFRNEQESIIREARVRAVAHHPHGRVLLNLLLPRKEIPNPLEKLYWLVFPNDTYGKQEQEISDEQQAGIRALWRILSRYF